MDYTVKKISEFPENEYPLTGDCILVEHNPAADGIAKKMTLTQLLQFMNIKSEAHPAGTMYIQFKGGKLRASCSAGHGTMYLPNSPECFSVPKAETPLRSGATRNRAYRPIPIQSTIRIQGEVWKSPVELLRKELKTNIVQLQVHLA